MQAGKAVQAEAGRVSAGNSAGDGQAAIHAAGAVDRKHAARVLSGERVDQTLGNGDKGLRALGARQGLDDRSTGVAPLAHRGVERDLTEQRGLREVGDLLPAAAAEELVLLAAAAADEVALV